MLVSPLPSLLHLWETDAQLVGSTQFAHQIRLVFKQNPHVIEELSILGKF
jgi:hypothetical protein